MFIMWSYSCAWDEYACYASLYYVHRRALHDQQSQRRRVHLGCGKGPCMIRISLVNAMPKILQDIAEGHKALLYRPTVHLDPSEQLTGPLRMHPRVADRADELTPHEGVMSIRGPH